MRRLLNRVSYVLFVVCSVLFGTTSCKKEYTPKPRGYYRIQYPEKSYSPFSENCPYVFEKPDYMSVVPTKGGSDDDYWYTLESKEHHAEIHLSYKRIDHNLPLYLEDSRRMVYKHAIKATSIEEELYRNESNSVFGVLYELEGNTASPLQFVLTDSVNNFVRGALYFREIPNADSIRPSIEFFSEDVRHIIESTKWVDHGS